MRRPGVSVFQAEDDEGGMTSMYIVCVGNERCLDDVNNDCLFWYLC